MSKNKTEVAICPWPDDKRWVYSITFDEALSDLHRFAVPILEKHHVPGHLEAVVGQMGEVRNLGQSSYNGFMHMSVAEMKEMLARGWGVGNHSWSHFEVNAETADLELRQAKEVLEKGIGQPITIYCAPGNNYNMNDGALAACRKYGYLGAMGITDALNRPEDKDLFWMNRSFLHDQSYEPFYSEFDPFRNIQHARRDRGWIIDYCHCPLEKPVHRNKDCSADQLRERIETIVAEGGDEVWLARVEDAVDYRYTRRAARIEMKGQGRCEIKTEELHPAVRKKTLTLSVTSDLEGVEVDGKTCKLRKCGERTLFNVDLSGPRQVQLIPTHK